jgi:hypothetical protein
MVLNADKATLKDMGGEGDTLVERRVAHQAECAVAAWLGGLAPVVLGAAWLGGRGGGRSRNASGTW